jgi:lysophospholipase L1-like esterase
MTQFSRRSLIAGSLGAGLALPSMARAIEGCGEQPNTAPALQPPRLLDTNGNVKLSFAKDEVHPTAEGYAAMRPIAEAAISERRRPRQGV